VLVPVAIAILAFNREGRHIAIPQRFDLFRRPFNILRPDIAAIVEDQILGAPGKDDFAIEPIAHVAGIEIAVVADRRICRLGVVIITGHQARRLDENAADFAFAENAAQTLDYVSRGEVDAGFVFASEALGNDSVKIVYTAPKGAIKPVRYVAAPIKASANATLAEKFVAHLLAPEAQAVLEKNGFKPAPTAAQ